MNRRSFVTSVAALCVAPARGTAPAFAAPSDWACRTLRRILALTPAEQVQLAADLRASGDPALIGMADAMAGFIEPPATEGDGA